LRDLGAGFKRMIGAVRYGLWVTLLTLACGGARWHDEAPGLYRYDPPIERYAPGEPGLWVVTARDDTPDGRRRVAALVEDPEDVAGQGFVVWLDADRAATLRARREVAAVEPLQPEARLGVLPAAARVPVRIDVAAHRDDVIAWLARHGVRATATAPRTIDAEVTPALARTLARLGPVRWVEYRRQ
jgi:hypothetical protein